MLSWSECWQLAITIIARKSFTTFVLGEFQGKTSVLRDPTVVFDCTINSLKKSLLNYCQVSEFLIKHSLLCDVTTSDLDWQLHNEATLLSIIFKSTPLRMSGRDTHANMSSPMRTLQQWCISFKRIRQPEVLLDFHFPAGVKHIQLSKFLHPANNACCHPELMRREIKTSASLLLAATHFRCERYAKEKLRELFDRSSPRDAFCLLPSLAALKREQNAG